MRVIIGKNKSKAQGQFQINPRLQRTQASGNEQGLTLGSVVPRFKVVQDGIVTLPNRSVPLNLDMTPNKKKVPKRDAASLQGVPRSRN